MNWRQIKWLGGVATAVVAVVGVVRVAVPVTRDLLNSDSPPWVGQVQVASSAAQAVAPTLLAIQKAVETIGQQTNRNELELSKLKLDQAEHENSTRPSEAARRALQDAKDQLNLVRKQIGLPALR